MALGTTLHMATGGYRVEPADLRCNPLAIATEFRAQFLLAPPPPVSPPVPVRRHFSGNSAYVIVLNEFDRSLR